MDANYQLWLEIDDLLDDYRDEIYRETRHGWNRYDSPENIRYEINSKIKKILGITDD